MLKTRSGRLLSVGVMLTFGVLVAGCGDQNTSNGGPPSGPPAGRRGPGGPGGGPGGPGGAVAANASAAEIFQQKCQGCHGADGQGARGPSLANAGSLSDADLKSIIHDGKGRMPPAGSALTDPQLTSLAAYVKGLSSKK